MVKKGTLTLQKDNKQGSFSSKDKSKTVKKNCDVVNDGVVDTVTPEPSKATFNLTRNMHAAKSTK